MHIQMLLPLDRYVLTTHDSYYKAHLAVFPTTIKETQVMQRSDSFKNLNFRLLIQPGLLHFSVLGPILSVFLCL